MKLRVSTDTVILVGFLLLLGLASARIAATSADPGREMLPHRTVTSARPSGWKALRLLLEKQGATTKLLRQPATKWARDQRLIVTGPAYSSPGQKINSWTDEEARAARAWVMAGGTLIVFADEGTPLLNAFDVTWEGEGKQLEAIPCLPSEALGGVHAIAASDAGKLNSTSGRGIALLRANGDSFVQVLSSGQGKVVVIASPGFIDNSHIGRADNARLAIQLIQRIGPSGSTVYFDEFRQGFEDGKSFWEIVGPSGQRLAWQLAGVLLLLAWSAGTRFGLACPLPANRRLSSEYVASLGDLYRRAGARDLALEAAAHRLRHDLAGRTGLSHDAPEADLIKRAAAALGGADPKGVADRLSVLFHDIQSALDAGKKEFSSRDLLALVQRIETARKELGIDGF